MAALAFVCGQSSAQMTPQFEILPIESYVTEHLLEPGALVSNITLTGSEEQLLYGYDLDSVGYGFPHSTCVLLSNSWSLPVLDPDWVAPYQTSAYTPPPFGGPWTSADGGVYEDLLNLSNEAITLLNAVDEEGDPIFNNEIFDVAAIEFDIIPTNDTLTFRYNLGGNEFHRSNNCYPTPYGGSYASCEYNDIFGIFVSGPGLAGPYSAPAGYPDGSENVAFVPGTLPPLPMCTTGINDSTNTQFLVDYCELVPDTTPEGWCQLDINATFFTTLFTHNVPVTCGETYHVRIAIGDVFDHIYSTHAMLGLIGGTGNGGYNASMDFSFQPLVVPTENAFEDCNPIFLNVHRSNVSDIAQPDSLLLFAQGVGVMGIDYSILPDTVVIPAGQTSVSIQIDIVDDGLPEGAESVDLALLPLTIDEDGCASYASFTIYDGPEPLVASDMNVVVCASDNVVLEAQVSGGYGAYSYQWYNGEDESSITLIDPDIDGEYYVIVSDTCGMPSDTAYFSLVAVPELQVSIALDSIPYGCNVSIPITAEASGGFGEYNYTWSPWFNGDDEIEYNTLLGPGTVTVTVEDDCGTTVSDAVEIYLSEGLPFEYAGPASVYGGCDGVATLQSNLSGGFQPITVFWATAGGVLFGNEVNVPFVNDAAVTVLATDGCGQSVIASILIVAEPEPISLSLPGDLAGTCADLFSINPTIQGGEAPFSFEWTANSITVGNDSLLVDYSSSESQTISLEVLDDCDQVVSATIALEISSTPLVVADIPDIAVNCGEEANLSVDALGGDGVLSYSWTSGGELLGNTSDITITADLDLTTIDLIVSDECGQEDSQSVAVDLLVDPLLVDLGENQTIPCNELAEVAAEIIGGNGIISGQWMINGIPNAETSLFLEEQLTESGMISYSASDQCGQNATDSVAIWLEFIPLTADSAAFSLCEAEEFFIEVIANGGNGVLSYQWPFGIGSEGEWVTIDASQSWEVLVTDECGQTASASILVELTVLSADFSASDTGNGSYLFEVEQTCDACTYEWDFGDGSFSEFGESVSHSFDGATEYITTLMVDNEVGCSAEQFFVVQPTIFLYIPTSFTPDGDGLNEAFYVVATGFVSFQLTIYNRWGEQIFYTEDLNQGWIGNFQNGEYYVPNGTYLYDVLCIDPYGVPVRRQGPLTLIR